MSRPRQRSPRQYTRGFTLVELLIVVAMIGVLAALAVVGYRQYILAAHTGEAKQIMMGIRGAQENYKAETLTYLGCSGSYSDYYPAAPDDRKRNWTDDTHSDAACWRQLHVVTDAPVRFGFAVVAGPPGEQPPANDMFSNPPTWPASPPEPWFVVQATGDRDVDNAFSLFVNSSFSAEIYVENDTE